MSLINSLRNIFNKTTTNNKLYRSLYSYFSIGSVVNIPDNQRNYVKKGYESAANLFAIIDFIATKAAKVPFILYEITEEGQKKKVERHPILDLLERPNTFTNRSEFLRQLYSFRLVTGNGYIYAPRLEDGRAIELYVMPSPLTQIISGGWLEPVGGYSVQYAGGQSDIDADDVLHLKAPNLDYENGRDLYGMSPLKPLLQTLEKDLTNADAQKNMMANQGAAGVISPDIGPESLDDATYTAMQNRIDDRFNNSENKGKIMLASVKTTVQTLGLTSVELGMLEDAKFNIQTYCRVYHVPSMLFMDDAATFNNFATARRAAYTDAILPLVEELIDGLNSWIIQSFGPNLILDYDTGAIEELQTDKVSAAQWLNQAWWVSVGRKQEIIGEIPDPEMMDVYLVPSGLMPITNAVNPMQLDTRLMDGEENDD
jgi:HK97 family phage portal protein